ncbi:dinitrogenase iron-molybdenum cofactor biosynthesis protein [Methylomonas sp. SURF-2]|uniref:Dinitrogenase iron-molybdenum cofactor biosynthesis protein n=1 Tax=Methylomonas subterranea TaxID=2952225 RepID=A0ABT1TH32_9GAMM|nr:NifB/NifX family molybdenum-iron cluster-binding protein [Methylomonas sp. SURF-2]MCQ8104745.1 dinitrogenase iron-molybdenum cofactor biosynthesis protein [Methylomonas sp. SURF-2]
MSGFPLLVAVASKEGMAISEHFGHAKQFRIYQADPEQCRYIETREVAHYCLGQQGDQAAMAGILEAIKDCHAVFVAKIGDGPTERLNNIGVRAVAEYAYEAIEASLLAYAGKLAEQLAAT